ncbi:hypothetical protein [Bacillus sp. FSL K6-3431]
MYCIELLIKSDFVQENDKDRMTDTELNLKNEENWRYDIETF